jgi:hypothetical protein
VAEQNAAQDVPRPQVTNLQQQVAQRSPDLDAAPAEPAQTRQDIAAPEMERNAQEQQSAAATAGTPMATAPAADPVASTGPPRNGAEAVAVADAPRMTPTTATLRTPGDVADTAASTGPPRDGAATVAVTDPTRVPATTEALQVQVDFARAGAQAGRPQPGAVPPVEVIVVTARPGKTRAGSDSGASREQTAKSGVARAVALDTRANAARPCARSGSGAECPASDRRGLAAARPMPIEINALSAVPNRCLNILKRVQLGEALTDDDRTVLQTNCGPG